MSSLPPIPPAGFDTWQGDPPLPPTPPPSLSKSPPKKQKRDSDKLKFEELMQRMNKLAEESLGEKPT